MKTLLAKYRAWLERRRQKNLYWWKQKRTQGKSRYVLWVINIYGGWMITVTSIVDYYDHGRLDADKFLFKLIFYTIGGFIVGLVGWEANERKYRQSVQSHSNSNVSVNQTYSSTMKHNNSFNASANKGTFMYEA